MRYVQVCSSAAGQRNRSSPRPRGPLVSCSAFVRDLRPPAELSSCLRVFLPSQGQTGAPGFPGDAGDRGDTVRPALQDGLEPDCPEDHHPEVLDHRQHVVIDVLLHI